MEQNGLMPVLRSIFLMPGAVLIAFTYEKAYALTFSNNIRGPFSIGWWVDPVILGKTPKDVEDYLGVKELFTSDELAFITQPLDFLGFNIYTPAGTNKENSCYQTNEYEGCQEIL